MGRVHIATGSWKPAEKVAEATGVELMQQGGGGFGQRYGGQHTVCRHLPLHHGG